MRNETPTNKSLADLARLIEEKKKKEAETKGKPAVMQDRPGSEPKPGPKPAPKRFERYSWKDKADKTFNPLIDELQRIDEEEKKVGEVLSNIEARRIETANHVTRLARQLAAGQLLEVEEKPFVDENLPAILKEVEWLKSARETNAKLDAERSAPEKAPAKAEAPAAPAPEKEKPVSVSKKRYDGFESPRKAYDGTNPYEKTIVRSYMRPETKAVASAEAAIEAVEEPTVEQEPVVEAPMSKEDIAARFVEVHHSVDGVPVASPEEAASIVETKEEVIPSPEKTKEEPTFAPVENNEHGAEPKPLENPKEVLGNNFERKKIVLDGTVEFNLGKLGIIDVSDPNKSEQMKQEAISRLQAEVPNFLNLSDGQQLFVIKKLREKLSHDLDRKSAEYIKQKDSEGLIKPTGGKLNKFITGVRNFPKTFARGMSKNTRTAMYRTSEVEKMKAGGLSSYAESLNQLSDFTKRRGKEIKVDDKGRMIVEFLGHDVVEEKHQAMIDNFNTKASILAEIPGIWSEHANPLQKRQLKVAQAEFEKAKAELSRYESKLNKGAESTRKSEIALGILNTEEEINLNRDLSHNPEITGLLEKWAKTYKIDERLVSMGLGGTTRGFATYAAALGGGFAGATFVAGMGASALTGGVMGRLRKGKEILLATDKRRYGAELNKSEAKGVKEMIDAKTYGEKMNNFMDRLEKTTDPASYERMLQSLQDRYELANSRRAEKLIGWGKPDQEIANKVIFGDAMKRAKRFFFENSMAAEDMTDKIAEAMERKFFKDNVKMVEKKEELRAAFKRGAKNGALFFVIGFEASDQVLNDGETTKAIWNEVQEASKVVLEKTGEFAQDVNAAADVQFAKVGRAAVDMVDGNSAMDPKVTGINKPDFQKLKVMSEGYKEWPKSIGSDRNINFNEPYSKFPDSIGADRNIGGDAPYGNMPGSIGADRGGMGALTTEAMVGGTSFEQAVGGRGIIGAIDDLQDNVRRVYGDNIPEGLKAFMATKPDKVAIEWGAYRPGEDAESMRVMKGSKIDLMSDGSANFTDSSGNVVRLGGGEKFAGEFYDGSKSAGAPESAAAAEAEEDFEEVMTKHNIEGWTHNDAGMGDTFSKEMPMGAGATGSEGLLASSEAGDADMASHTLPAEGMPVSTPEIKGTMIAKYDDFGRVTRMAWAPQSRIEEVVKFKATPDKFLVEDLDKSGLKFPTRSFGTSELRRTVVTDDCIKYLETRAMLRAGGFPPGSPESNYLLGQMRLFGASIEAKAGAIFKPIQEDGILRGMKAPRIDNIPPTELSPKIETPMAEAKPAYKGFSIKPMDESGDAGLAKSSISEPMPEKSAPFNDPKFKPFSEAIPTNNLAGKVVNFDAPSVKGDIKFLEDSNGKYTSLAPGPIKTTYDSQWAKFLEDDWETKAKAIARAAGKDEASFRDEIQTNVRNYIKYETLAKRGGLSGTFPEGQAILERQVKNIIKQYGDFIKNEEYDAITNSIEARS